MKRPEEETLERLSAALARFEEALALPASEGANLDGTIQRFEFTFELTWKCAKRALALKGVDARSPRDSIKECYAQGWIDDEATWVLMLKDRNLTSHTYVEDIAREVYGRLSSYSGLIRGLLRRISDVISSNEANS
jgi:nucleotidyltransferase substrate binding protein (TIGR01987 family)